MKFPLNFFKVGEVVTIHLEGTFRASDIINLDTTKITFINCRIEKNTRISAQETFRYWELEFKDIPLPE